MSFKVTCLQCSNVISENCQKLFKETFTNPLGIVHHIFKVRDAKNIYIDPLKFYEYSYYPGYSHQIIYCSACQQHLGWRYTKSSPDIFYGLLDNSLRIEPKIKQAPIWSWLAIVFVAICSVVVVVVAHKFDSY